MLSTALPVGFSTDSALVVTCCRPKCHHENDATNVPQSVDFVYTCFRMNLSLLGRVCRVNRVSFQTLGRLGGFCGWVRSLEGMDKFNVMNCSFPVGTRAERVRCVSFCYHPSEQCIIVDLFSAQLAETCRSCVLALKLRTSGKRPVVASCRSTWISTPRTGGINLTSSLLARAVGAYGQWSVVGRDAIYSLRGN